MEKKHKEQQEIAELTIGESVEELEKNMIELQKVQIWKKFYQVPTFQIVKKNLRPTRDPQTWILCCFYA